MTNIAELRERVKLTGKELVALDRHHEFTVCYCNFLEIGATAASEKALRVALWWEVSRLRERAQFFSDAQAPDLYSLVKHFADTLAEMLEAEGLERPEEARP